MLNRQIWGFHMEDKRRNMRTTLKSKLLIKKLGTESSGMEVPIEITDVSKTGVGFNCIQPLEIGAVYEAFITIWTKEVIHAFIEIIRIEKREDSYSYGGIFIGMPEMDAARIEIYQTVSSETDKINK